MYQLANTAQGNAITPHEELSQGVRELLQESRAASTRRMYRVQLDSFTSWAHDTGRTGLITAGAVAEYILHLVQDNKSASTIAQALASIGLACRAANQEDVTKSEIVKSAAKSARKKIGTAPHKKAAATVQVIKCLLEGLDRSTAAGKRDAALLLLGFAGAFRRSELAALNFEDLELATQANGKLCYLVTVRKSKTDQEGQGMVKGIFSTCTKDLDPMAALEAWINVIPEKTGPIFRRIRKGDKLTSERISDKAVALIVQAAARRSNIVLDLAGHSLRSGFITSALEAGAGEREVMNQSGHKSVTVMRSYNQRQSALQDNAASKLADLM